ncbi:MAG: hypothetical protein KDL87_12335, partial [Verrucomicrobiae bacterium]|nr:hypothetical protein [Verrucomicrobiae bacterium]
VNDAECEAQVVAYFNEQRRLDEEEEARRMRLAIEERAEAAEEAKDATLRELEEAREKLAVKDVEIHTARAEVVMIGAELERVKEVADKQNETSAARISELETRVEATEEARDSAIRNLEVAREELATVTSEKEAEVQVARAETDRVGRELENVKESASERLKASTARIEELEGTVKAAEVAKEAAMGSQAAASRKVAEMESQIQSSKITATIAAKAINLLQRIVASPFVMKILGKDNDLRKELMDFGKQTGIQFAVPPEKSVEQAPGQNME